MRLGSLYNKTKPEKCLLSQSHFNKTHFCISKEMMAKKTHLRVSGFYLPGYGLVTAWHVICDAVSHDKTSREIKLFSSDKTPLAIFRFGNEVVQDNKHDAAILQDVSPAILKEHSPSSIKYGVAFTKGDRISAYQHHFSESRFSFELHSGDLLRVGEPSEEGTLCYTNCSFRHGMSGGPVFNGLGGRWHSTYCN